MNIEDLHEIICEALRRMGGVDGGEVVDEGLNADVVHHGHRVITEVKTVFHDRALSEAHKKYAHKVIAKYRKSAGLDPNKYDVGAEDLPVHVQRLITKDFLRPFEKDVKTANKQIRNTKRYTGDDYSGLLIIGLPNNYFANEGSAFSFLSRDNVRFREIDCVLMLAVDPNDPPVQPARVVLTERNQGAIPREFLGEFDQQWINALESYHGEKMHRFKRPDGAFVQDFGLDVVPKANPDKPKDPKN